MSSIKASSGYLSNAAHKGRNVFETTKDFEDYLYYGLNFRMWFKNGLKAQKLLAQGIALGMMAISKAPCKGKSLMFAWSFKAFALTGRQACVRNYPGRCPGLGASALSGRVGQNLRNLKQ